MATQLENQPMRCDPEISRIVQPFEQGPQEAFPNEARADARWHYPVTQLVAFHEEPILPTKEMFEAVQCIDISRGGISFYYPSSPPSGYCTFIYFGTHAGGNFRASESRTLRAGCGARSGMADRLRVLTQDGTALLMR